VHAARRAKGRGLVVERDEDEGVDARLLQPVDERAEHLEDVFVRDRDEDLALAGRGRLAHDGAQRLEPGAVDRPRSGGGCGGGGDQVERLRERPARRLGRARAARLAHLRPAVEDAALHRHVDRPRLERAEPARALGRPARGPARGGRRREAGVRAEHVAHVARLLRRRAAAAAAAAVAAGRALGRRRDDLDREQRARAAREPVVRAQHGGRGLEAAVVEDAEARADAVDAVRRGQHQLLVEHPPLHQPRRLGRARRGLGLERASRLGAEPAREELGERGGGGGGLEQREAGRERGEPHRLDVARPAHGRVVCAVHVAADLRLGPSGRHALVVVVVREQREGVGEEEHARREEEHARARAQHRRRHRPPHRRRAQRRRGRGGRGGRGGGRRGRIDRQPRGRAERGGAAAERDEEHALGEAGAAQRRHVRGQRAHVRRRVRYHGQDERAAAARLDGRRAPDGRAQRRVGVGGVASKRPGGRRATE
jgi:hypothetical protein